MSSARPRKRTLPLVPAYPIPVDQVVVEVVADPANEGGRLVLQDGVESSYVDILRPERLGFEYQRHLASLVDVMHPKRLSLDVFQIGGGPCAVVRYLDATRKTYCATVAEIDSGVIAVAKEYLGLEPGPRLTIVIGDGREQLAHQPIESLDVVIIDAFTGLVVPHHLVTSECTALVRRALRPGGLHLVNLIDIPPHAFARAVVATLSESGQNVVVLADPRVMAGTSSGNFVIAATERTIPVDVVARRARQDTDPWEVMSGRALQRWVGDNSPLRDDLAPTHDLALMGELFGRARRRKDDL